MGKYTAEEILGMIDRYYQMKSELGTLVINPYSMSWPTMD